MRSAAPARPHTRPARRSGLALPDQDRARLRRLRAEYHDTYRDRSRPQHPDGASRGVGQIDHATLDVRTAIVDVHLDAAAVRLVGHDDPAAERQRAMRGGEVVLIESLAAGGALTVEPGAVP